MADHIFYYNDEEFVLPSGNEEEIIFSPGRCGTHVLKEVVNVQNFCHHDGQFVTSPNLNKTIDSKKIFVIIRRNFFKFTISHFARNTVGKVMLTWASNFNENKKIIDQINSLTITENDFLHELNTISTFLDIILGFNFLWKKEISLCYFEDLSSHFDKVKIMKNPYDTKDIVDNYDQAIDLGNKYQPIYDSLLQQVNLIFKLAQL